MKCGNVTLLRADKILAMPTLHCLKRFLRETKKAKTFLQESEPEGPTLLQNLQCTKGLQIYLIILDGRMVLYYERRK